MKCYLLVRKTSAYTETELVLGLFSSELYARRARRLYIQYATQYDSHFLQGYMDVNLEKDVVVMPFDVPDLKPGQELPATAMIVAAQFEGFGQVNTLFKRVFVTPEAVITYLTKNEYTEDQDQAAYPPHMWVIPRTIDAFEKEPQPYETYGTKFVCKKCNKLPPLWSSKNYVRMRFDVDMCTWTERDLLPARETPVSRKRVKTDWDDIKQREQLETRPPKYIAKYQRWLDASRLHEEYRHALFDTTVLPEAVSTVLEYRDAGEVLALGLAPEVIGCCDVVEVLQPRKFWKCPWCDRKEFTTICISFVAVLHAARRHQEAMELTELIAAGW
jgi:hypothetical protein